MFLYFPVQKKGFPSASTTVRSCFPNSSLPSTERIPPLLNNYYLPSFFQAHGHFRKEETHTHTPEYTHTLVYRAYFKYSPPDKMLSTSSTYKASNHLMVDNTHTHYLLNQTKRYLVCLYNNINAICSTMWIITSH